MTLLISLTAVTNRLPACSSDWGLSRVLMIQVMRLLACSTKKSCTFFF